METIGRVQGVGRYGRLLVCSLGRKVEALGFRVP